MTDEANQNGVQTSGSAFTPDEVMRYSRHMIMGQVGPVGQRQLRNASVLVVGAGGLGCGLDSSRSFSVILGFFFGILAEFLRSRTFP